MDLGAGNDINGFTPYPDGMIRLAGVSMPNKRSKRSGGACAARASSFNPHAKAISMLSFIGRRLLIAIPTILLISVFVFFLQKLLPGDPVLALAGEDRNPEILAFLREKYRLNDPLYVQYFHWIGNALRGDLGISLAHATAGADADRRKSCR